MTLLGRGGALAVGTAAIDAAAAGRGQVVVVTGEAGLGKTTLVRALADHAASAGAVVRWGVCWQGMAALQPWIDALAGVGGDACAAVAEQMRDEEAGTTEAGGARSAVHEAVVSALRSAATARPQVVVLEDVHDADDETLRLLRAVSARAASLRVLALVTARDDELTPDHPLRSLPGAVDRLALAPLGPDDSRALLDDVLGRPASATEADEVVPRSGGNPLFLVQMGRLVAAGRPGAVPSAVRDVIDRRIARLDPTCRKVLGLASALGVAFHRDVLIEMASDVDAAAVDEALEEARLAGVVDAPEQPRSPWRFTHALVRDARYEALGATGRADLHRRACDVLASRPGIPASELAHHASRARFEPDDPTPARLSLAAGEEARRRLAFDEAAAHDERAIGQAPPGEHGDVLRAEAWLAIGSDRLALAWDPDHAGSDPAPGDAFSEAAAIARHLGDAQLLARAALGFGVGFGGFEVHMLDPRQVTLLEEAVAATGPGDGARPLLLARLSVARSFVATPERREELAVEALALARDRGDRHAEVAALAALADARSGPSWCREREELADRMIAIGVEQRDLRAELLGRRFRVVTLAEQCRFHDLDAEIRAYERGAAALGEPLYAWYGPLWRGMRALTEGRVDAAAELDQEVRALAERAGSANGRILAAVLDIYVTVARDGWEQAADTEVMQAPGMQELALSNGEPMPVYARHRAGETGVAPAARTLVERASGFVVDAEWFPAMAALVDLAHELGLVDLVDTLRTLVDGLEDIAVVEGIAATVRGPGARWLALLAADAGDGSETLRLVDRSLELASGMGALVLADARRAAADALRTLDPDRFTTRADELDAAAEAAERELGLPRATESAAPSSRSDLPAEQAALTREGDAWAAVWGGTTVRVRHSKGLADLAVLLSRPGQEVHVRQLAGAGADTSPSAGGSDAVLDERAVDEYRRRLAAVEVELDEADAANDLARSERLAVERDALVAELSAAFGLGGRSRRLGSSDDERMRKAVAGRVKATIDRIEELHGPLGRHLRNSIRTGLWCSYRPEKPVTWDISP